MNTPKHFAGCQSKKKKKGGGGGGGGGGEEKKEHYQCSENKHTKQTSSML